MKHVLKLLPSRRSFLTLGALAFAALFLSAQASYTPDSRPGGRSNAALQAQIGVPTGTILPYAGTTAPAGFLLAYGQSLSVSAYPNLFAAIGYTYGGSGSNFTMPDLRGRSLFGKDNMGGSAANRVTNAISGITGTTLGSAGGSESMQAHTHTYTQPDAQAAIDAAAGGSINVIVTRSAGVATSSTGAGSSQNMPPAIITNFIVKT